MDKKSDEVSKYIPISNIKKIFDRWVIDRLDETIDPAVYKHSYQDAYIERLYPKRGLCSPIEYVGMTMHENLVVTLILMCEYIHNRNSFLLNNIHRPVIFDTTDKLYLSLTTINDLDVLTKDKGKKGLLDVIDFTSTAIGKRALKDTLLNPITDVKTLKSIYRSIEYMKDNVLLNEIIPCLKGTPDLERLFKKVYSKRLNPCEWPTVMMGLERVINLIGILSKDKNLNFLSERSIKNINSVYAFIKNRLNLNECSKYILDTIDGMLFKQGIYGEVDLSYRDYKNVYEVLHQQKQNIFAKIKQQYPDVKDDITKISYSKAIGYYISIPNKFSSLFKNTFTTKKVSKGASLQNDIIKNATSKILYEKKRLVDICRSTYIDFMSDISDRFFGIFNIVCKLIGNVDVLVSKTKLCTDYKYCRPTIKKEETSYFKSKHMRHAICERIDSKEKFISNDIDVDGDNSTLLYSINGSGKSVMLKMAGICVLLAQSGFYVPCKSFTYYPYRYFITKISLYDNMYYGNSTYKTEMLSLADMFRHMGKNTLLLADELCCGTETDSAVSIVGRSIYKMIKTKTSFIFTSHLHEVPNCVQYYIDRYGDDIHIDKDAENNEGTEKKSQKLPKSQTLQTLHIRHIKTTLTKEGDVIYMRKLSQGQGPQDYGIEIARHLHISTNDDTFIDDCHKFRNILKNRDKNMDSVDNTFLSTKTSKYNASLYIDRCERCGSTINLDVDHIDEQKNADDNGYLSDGEYKNRLSNLRVLCKKCHILRHNE